MTIRHSFNLSRFIDENVSNKSMKQIPQGCVNSIVLFYICHTRFDIKLFGMIMDPFKDHLDLMPVSNIALVNRFGLYTEIRKQRDQISSLPSRREDFYP